MDNDQEKTDTPKQPAQPVNEVAPNPAPSQTPSEDIPADQLASDGDEVVKGLEEG